MNENKYQIHLKMLGVPDRYIDHGTPKELHHECGFDVEGIVKSVQAMVKRNLLSNAG